MTPSVPGYHLIRELGSGASAKVWLARQLALDRQVALKILAPGLFDAEETRGRFLREARLLFRNDLFGLVIYPLDLDCPLESQ